MLCCVVLFYSTYIYIYVCIYTSFFMYVYICVYMSMYIFVICIRLSVCMFACLHVCMFVFLYVYMFVCLYVLYLCTFVHLYVCVFMCVRVVIVVVGSCAYVPLRSPVRLSLNIHNHKDGQQRQSKTISFAGLVKRSWLL